MKHTDLIKALKAATNSKHNIFKYAQIGKGEAIVTDLETYVIVKDSKLESDTVAYVESSQFTSVFAKSFDGLNILDGKASVGQVTLNNQDNEISYPRVSSIFGESEWDEWFECTSAQLIDLFSNASKFMAKNDVRYYLNGCNLKVNDTVTATSSDGHRLLTRTSSIVPNFESSVIVYRAAIKLIESLKDDNSRVSVWLGTSVTDVGNTTGSKVQGNVVAIKFMFDNVTIITKLHDSNYPDFGRFYKQTFDECIVADVPNALKRLKEVKNLITTGDKFNAVKLYPCDDYIRVTNYKEEELCLLPAALKTEVSVIALNYSYLIDLLSCISLKSATLKVPTDGSSIMLECDGTKTIQMGMRL